MTSSPEDCTEAGTTPASLRAPEPAPEVPLLAPGAECGEAPVNRPGLARAAPAADGDGRRGNLSRRAGRGGTAGAGTRSPAPAPSSALTAAPPADGADRGAAESPPAPSRNAPAAGTSPGGRGTQDSPLPARGSGAGRGAQSSPPVPLHPRDAGGARGGEPAPPMRTAGAGSPPDMSAAGGGRTGDAPPAAEALSGQAFRDAVRKAQSDAAALRRRGRGRYPVKRQGDGYRPGGARRMPPGGAA
jgi:hypothetical protein